MSMVNTMFAAVWFVLSLLLSPIAAQSGLPTVEVYSADSFFRSDVRRSDGTVVRGLGFKAWRDGAGVQVLVVLLIPTDPSRPRGREPREGEYRYERLALFQVAVGASRTIDEMKTLGADPMSVRVFPAGAHSHK
jgi:hypothetical protein